jgi:hypothetical protein
MITGAGETAGEVGGGEATTGAGGTTGAAWGGAGDAGGGDDGGVTSASKVAFSSVGSAVGTATTEPS